MNKEEILKELSILYVEDEELMRKNLAMLLQRRVQAVYVAENGQEGLNKFSEIDPDVIITDIEMPVMNGIEMIKEIRKLSSDRPIVILTAFNDDEHNSDLANVRLVKPIMKEELLDALVDCIQRGRS